MTRHMLLLVPGPWRGVDPCGAGRGGGQRRVSVSGGGEAADGVASGGGGGQRQVSGGGGGGGSIASEDAASGVTGAEVRDAECAGGGCVPVHYGQTVRDDPEGSGGGTDGPSHETRFSRVTRYVFGIRSDQDELLSAPLL